MKKVFQKIGHFCSVLATGLIIMMLYGHAVHLDEYAMKISGMAVLLIAWMLEQRHIDDEA